MAKELPYFQFEPAEYLTKDVSFCSLAAQGLFINLCAYYWQRECSLTKEQILRRLNYPKELNELITEGVIDLEGENIIIKFLDVQYDNATTKSRINSENGAKGGRSKLDTELTAYDGKIIPRNPKTTDHFLYMFKRKSTGAYKIGETQDLFKRRNTIKIPSNDLEIVHFEFIEKQFSLETESEIKNKFISNHINGDWFDFNKDEVNSVICFMAKKAIKKQKNSESKGIREDKIKEDNIIEEEIIKPKEINLVFPFTSENFIYQWQIWKRYKKEQHKFTYKSEATEQAALTQLQKMATNRELKAIEIIHHTMANGWKGFVEPKSDPRKETQDAFQAVKEKINFDFSDGKLSFER
jgi:hypothetical protein